MGVDSAARGVVVCVNGPEVAERAGGWVVDLSAVSAADAATVGSKASNLGELIGAGFAVPSGFVVPASGYRRAMELAGVRGELAELHGRALTAADDPGALAGLCGRMAELIRTAAVPPVLADAVRAAYDRLSGGARAVTAVRSSAMGDDGAGCSFAGMNASFTNVGDVDAALRRILDCWVSLVGPRAVAYRAAWGLAAEPAIAVVVQLMVSADRAGVAFTADPRTGDRDVIVVEAVLGQGEAVVSGAAEPDTYEVVADGLRLRGLHVGRQTHRIVRGPAARTWSSPSTPTTPACRC